MSSVSRAKIPGAQWGGDLWWSDNGSVEVDMRNHIYEKKEKKKWEKRVQHNTESYCVRGKASDDSKERGEKNI